MLNIISRHRKFFVTISMAVAFVFMLSAVSPAYSVLMCKMSKAEMTKEMDSETCCCKMEEAGSTGDNTTDTGSGLVSVKNLHKCCCSVSQSEGTAAVFSPVTNSTNTYSKDIHSGALIYTLPNPYYNNPHINSPPGDGAPVSGRSILITNSNFRI